MCVIYRDSGKLRADCNTLFPRSNYVDSPQRNVIVNSYSPKRRCIMVDIYQVAAKRRGKFRPLLTDTEVNNCFSMYKT